MARRRATFLIQVLILPRALAELAVINAFRLPAADAFLQDDIKRQSAVHAESGNAVGIQRSSPLQVWKRHERLAQPDRDLCRCQEVRRPQAPWRVSWCLPTTTLRSTQLPPWRAIFQSNHTIGTKNNPPITTLLRASGLPGSPWQAIGSRARRLWLFLSAINPGQLLNSVARIAPPYVTLIGNSGAANYASTFAQPLPAVGPGWRLAG